MANDSFSRDPATVAVDLLPVRLIKRTVLLLLGPFYFTFIAFVPLLCARRKGFRGWYWRLVKRACSRLLWLLSVRVEMSEANKRDLSTDTGSIIVINHRSHLDGFALMDVVPDEKWFTFAARRSCAMPRCCARASPELDWWRLIAQAARWQWKR